ncbi:hypothetical protein ABH906_001230 [Pseudomonas frederiksbergensis]
MRGVNRQQTEIQLLPLDTWPHRRLTLAACGNH